MRHLFFVALKEKRYNMSKSNNVVFKKKQTSFSVIANPAIDDRNISPAAGWLYVLIQRWITFNAPDFICSKAFLLSKYNSGAYMFNRAWDELKKLGYLKMYSHPTEGWSAELLDEAQPDTPHTFYLSLDGEIRSTNIDRAEKKAQKLAESSLEEDLPACKESFQGAKDHYPENHPNGDHYPENHSNGNHTNGNHSNGNGGNIINTPLKTSINTFRNNQSINPSYIDKVASTASKPKKIERLIDESIIRDIRDQINYDFLTRRFDKDILDTVVSCLAKMYATSEPQMYNQQWYAPEIIRKRSLSISVDLAAYVLECFSQRREPITNVAKYIETSLFNAPDTYGAHLENEIRVNGF